MIDWFVLLTPLLVLPIVLLFVFVGCALDHRILPPTPSLSLIMRLSNRAGAIVHHMSFNAEIEFPDPMMPMRQLTYSYGVELTPMMLPILSRTDGESLEASHEDQSQLGATPPVFAWKIRTPRVGHWTITCHVWRDAVNQYTFRGMPIIRDVVSRTETVVLFELIPDRITRDPIIQPFSP